MAIPLPGRTSFEALNAGQAPWDIPAPQKNFVDVADRITGAVHRGKIRMPAEPKKVNAEVQSLVEHLFRSESGKLASSLARAFGLSELDAVEDVVQDTMLAAMHTWSFRGVPENPTAWLYRVAKNKATDYLRRRRFEANVFEGIVPGLREATSALDIEKILMPEEIEDSMLRMMFACAHPGISMTSQITLILKTLGGFSVREIASAFVTEEKTIEKRLSRARNYFREHGITLDPLQWSDFAGRRDAVLTSLYLLFNEGYKRTESDGLLDKDLCMEALRLALLVSEHALMRSPEAFALIALMTLLAARFDSRTNAEGAIVLLADQDRSRWNAELISSGLSYLYRSQPDRYTSSYHLEAAIQAMHVLAPSYAETDWPAILGLYKRLYAVKPSPIIAMHEAVAMAQVHGPEAAIALLQASPLPKHYLYHAILGDVQRQAGRTGEARESFLRALALTRNAREKSLLEQKLAV